MTERRQPKKKKERREANANIPVINQNKRSENVSSIASLRKWIIKHDLEAHRVGS